MVNDPTNGEYYGGAVAAPLDLHARSTPIEPVVRALAEAGIPTCATIGPDLEAVKRVHADVPVIAGNVATAEGTEALIKAGALDKLGPNRASLAARLQDAIQMADQYQQNARLGQDDG